MNWRDDNGVTPVLGTILIMGITVVGISAVLFWGGPAIQAIQDQGEMAAMESEFSTLRESTLILREIDSSRVPVIPVNDGVLSLGTGSRLAFIMPHEEATDGCKFMPASGWGDASSDTLSVDIEAVCGASIGFTWEVAELDGVRVQVQPSTGFTYSGQTAALQVDGVDFGHGDWRITLEKTGNVWGHIFILGTERFEYTLNTISSSSRLVLEGGAMYREDRGRVFELARPPIQEDIFGTGEFLIRYPTYAGSEFGFSAPATVSAQVQLLGNHLRVAGEMDSLRFAFAGDMAEAWCNSMLLRQDLNPPGTYSQVGGYECEPTNLNPIQAVDYAPNSGIVPFELIQSRVKANVFV